MWDKKVVEKVDECVGDYTLAVSFRNIVDQFVWAFAGVYDPNSGSDRDFFGMSWLALSVGGTCCGAYGVISM
jgi:hypothetical protein